MTKKQVKLADQVFKRWVITDGDVFLDVYGGTQFYTTLKDAQRNFEEAVDEGTINADHDESNWWVQEVTLGTRYELEQEPKWVENK